MSQDQELIAESAEAIHVRALIESAESRAIRGMKAMKLWCGMYACLMCLWNMLELWVIVFGLTTKPWLTMDPAHGDAMGVESFYIIGMISVCFSAAGVLPVILGWWNRKYRLFLTGVFLQSCGGTLGLSISLVIAYHTQHITAIWLQAVFNAQLVYSGCVGIMYWHRVRAR